MEELVGILSVATVTVENGAGTTIQVDTRGVLPNRGSSDSVYFVKDENSTYRWDEDESKYYCVGRDYENIKIISGGNA